MRNLLWLSLCGLRVSLSFFCSCLFIISIKWLSLVFFVGILGIVLLR